ncbi:hypothetical protein ACX83E_25390, partial [Burkholderia pseudomallei]
MRAIRRAGRVLRAALRDAGASATAARASGECLVPFIARVPALRRKRDAARTTRAGAMRPR